MTAHSAKAWGFTAWVWIYLPIFGQWTTGYKDSEQASDNCHGQDCKTDPNSNAEFVRKSFLSSKLLSPLAKRSMKSADKTYHQSSIEHKYGCLERADQAHVCGPANYLNLGAENSISRLVCYYVWHIPLHVAKDVPEFVFGRVGG